MYRIKDANLTNFDLFERKPAKTQQNTFSEDNWFKQFIKSLLALN